MTNPHEPPIRAVASAAQCASEQFLADCIAVDIGGIEEVDAGVERRIDHRACAGLIDLPAEIVAADAYDGDFERSDAIAVVHTEQRAAGPGAKDRRSTERSGRIEVYHSTTANFWARIKMACAANGSSARTSTTSPLLNSRTVARAPRSLSGERSVSVMASP